MAKVIHKRSVDARVAIGLSIFAFAAFIGYMPDNAENDVPSRVLTAGAKQAECDRNSIKTQYGRLGCSLNDNRTGGNGVRILRLSN